MKKCDKGLSAPVMIVVTLLFIASLLFMYQDFFAVPKPVVAGLKIVKIKDSLAASYKKYVQAGEDVEETICWYFDGVEQRSLKGNRTIHVPPVAGRTVEVECIVRLNEGTVGAKEFRSKKYKYFTNKPASFSPSNYSPLTTYEIQVAAAKRAGKTLADWNETSEIEPVIPPVKVKRSAGAEEFMAAVEKANRTEEPGAVAYETASEPAATSQTPSPAGTAPAPPAIGNVAPQSAAVAGSAGQPAVEAPPTMETAAVAGGEEQNKAVKQPENLFGKKVEYFKSNSSEQSDDNAQKPAIPGSTTTTVTATGDTVEVQAVSSVTTVSSTQFSQIEGGGGSRTMADAIAYNDYAYLQYFIMSGRNVNSTDARGRTPLHSAVSGDSADAVNFMVFLLQNNADIRERDKEGKTPLHVAAAKKNLAAVLALLEQEKVSPAVGSNPEEIRKKRLVNLTDNRGQTPLHVAAAYDADGVASILINNGAEVNAGDSNKSTPLHYAVLNKAKNVLMVLLAAGADINARDKFEQTPLYFADVEIGALLKPKNIVKPKEEKDTKETSIKKLEPPSIPRVTGENSIKKPGK